MDQLTKKQAQIFKFVTQHINEKGYAPSLKEIAGHLGVSSVGSLHKHIVQLQRKGYINRRWNRSRSIELVQELNPLPPSRIPLVGTVAAGFPVRLRTCGTA